jgi:hypothetical protein
MNIDTLSDPTEAEMADVRATRDKLVEAAWLVGYAKSYLKCNGFAPYDKLVEADAALQGTIGLLNAVIGTGKSIRRI